MSKREFQTEVESKLLQLHRASSLYSHPEIFLRELISNSSDALDKLRHLTLVDESFKSLPFNPRIDLTLDEENKTLTIADTGIGMNEEDLISHLGTIARSGTKNFLSQLSGDAKKDSNLIGQFGVGFYSVFNGRRQCNRSHLPQSRRFRRTSLALRLATASPASGHPARHPRSSRHHRHHPLQRRGQAVRQQLAPAGDRQKILQPHSLPHLLLTYDKSGLECRREKIHQDPHLRAGKRRQRPLAATQIRAHRPGLQGAL